MVRMEDQIINLLKGITGEDEYIFDSIDDSKDEFYTLTGFLSNRFSFWLDIGSSLFTVASDKYSLTWDVCQTSAKLTQVIELEEDGTSITTIISTKESMIDLKVQLGRLRFEFATDEIIDHDSITFGNMTIGVPRGWANAEGPVRINADNSNKLIHDILGRPLDISRKERLTIYMPGCIGDSSFILRFTDGTSLLSFQENWLKKEEVHDMAAVMRALKYIIGDL